jgi:hypothetical protein
VEKDDKNRAMQVIMEGPHDGRTSTREIDGTSPVYTEFQFDVRGGGCVRFILQVEQAGGRVTQTEIKGIYSSRLEEAPECGV